ncbi:transposase [Actinospica sp. MGRD01-02]|uniref:Mutator family transposase n=1 Tax=Actinospica acidithermotolerans TaxID=2828514 RepID=A0A941INA3_9ACTN|nr:transposase [Actinospica acidithermotolerans]
MILGYDKHDGSADGSGNSRNGRRAKTVLTDVGPVEVKVPSDRAGTFEPQIVKKRQRRLSGVDEMVLSLSARGLTHGEISAHPAEVYGAEVSKTTISTISDIEDRRIALSTSISDLDRTLPHRSTRSGTEPEN